MLGRQSQRSLPNWRILSRHLFPQQSLKHRIQGLASNSKPPPPPNSTTSRLNRILSKCPRFLRPSLSALYKAPITHFSAFLILHELTAVVPLLGLAGAFHYFQWLPPYFAEGAWVLAAVEKFGSWFRKKGWIDAKELKGAEELVAEGEGNAEGQGRGRGRVSKWWGRGEFGTRLLIEFATAYAIVKLLIPVRLLVSAWGAPWFATWTVIPISNVLKRVLSMGRGSKGSSIKGPAQSSGTPGNLSGKKRKRQRNLHR